MNENIGKNKDEFIELSIKLTRIKIGSKFDIKYNVKGSFSIEELLGMVEETKIRLYEKYKTKPIK